MATHPERGLEIGSQVIVDAYQKWLSARDQSHACRHEPHHVMSSCPHPGLFWIQGKVLFKETQ